MMDLAGCKWLCRRFGVACWCGIPWCGTAHWDCSPTVAHILIPSALLPMSLCSGQEGEDRVADAERARQRAEQARRDLEANSGEERSLSCALVLPGSAALHV